MKGRNLAASPAATRKRPEDAASRTENLILSMTDRLLAAFCMDKTCFSAWSNASMIFLAASHFSLLDSHNRLSSWLNALDLGLIVELGAVWGGIFC